MLTLPSSSGRRMRAGLQGKQKSQRGTKSAKKTSFNTRVQYHVVPYVSDFEKGGVWYSSNDYDVAREREAFIRKNISENEALFRKNDDNLNAQGILTNQAVISRIQAAEAAVTAVLEEQDEQEVKFQLSQMKIGKGKKRTKEGDTEANFTLNMEKLSKVYRVHSRKALKEAQDRALRQEKHVKDLDACPSMPSPSFWPKSKKGITDNRKSDALRETVQNALLVSHMTPVSNPAA